MRRHLYATVMLACTLAFAVNVGKDLIVGPGSGVAARLLNDFTFAVVGAVLAFNFVSSSLQRATKILHEEEQRYHNGSGPKVIRIYPVRKDTPDD